MWQKVMSENWGFNYSYYCMYLHRYVKWNMNVRNSRNSTLNREIFEKVIVMNEEFKH
jgi:hypothetical protein